MEAVAGNVHRQAGTTHDGQARAGREVWLRERLAELVRNLGRIPNKNELTGFILRYQVNAAEIDALVGGGNAGFSAQQPSAAPSARSVSIPEARRPTDLTASMDDPPSNVPRIAPQAPRPEPGDPMTSAIDRPSDKVIRRAVDDLVDDWYRAGRELRYDDVTRLTMKRGLSAEQTAAILEELVEQGVAVAGLRVERRADDDLADEDEDPRGRQSSAAASDLVHAYLLEIGKYSLIWAEDEVRLGREIRVGLDADEILADESRRSALSPAGLASLHDVSVAGRRAHAEMVCANLRLVVSIAKHRSFNGCGVEFIDRVQDGNAGLMHAADKFDPALGYKFSTYATWWIRQAIDRGIGDRGRLIRVPVHVHEKLGQLRRVRRELVGRLGHDPTTTELAAALEWPAATVQAMLDYLRPVVSLDVLVGTEGDTTLGDLLSDRAEIDGRTDPVNCVIESAAARDLDRVLADLPERSAEVIRRRFGLHGAPEQTLDEIGLHFGVTRERIRQIEAKALDILRKPRNCNGLRCYLFEDYLEEPSPLPEREERRRAAPAFRSTNASAAAAIIDDVGITGSPTLDRQFLTEEVINSVDAS